MLTTLTLLVLVDRKISNPGEDVRQGNIGIWSGKRDVFGSFRDMVAAPQTVGAHPLFKVERFKCWLLRISVMIVA